MAVPGMAHLYFSLFLFLTFLLRQTLGQVLQNKTFDDSDSAVQYFGDWRKSAFSELDEGGGHMVTGDPNAQASFEFTGVAVYFLSPLWPYDVTTRIQLDSGPPFLLNLRDINAQQVEAGWETVASHIVWSCEGLENGPHVLSVTTVGTNIPAIVDGFIVTSFNQSATTTQVSSGSGPAPTITVHETTTTTASPVPPSSSRSGSVNILTMGLGAGMVFLVLTIVALICYSFWRRRQSPRNRLKIDLEKDFPSFPKPPRDLSLPLSLSTPTPNSPPTPQPPPITHSPEDRRHRVLAFVPRRPRNVAGGAIDVDSHRSTLDGPPPGYYESVNGYRRSRWGIARATTTPYTLDPLPPALFASVTGSQAPNPHAPPIRNKH